MVKNCIAYGMEPNADTWTKEKYDHLSKKIISSAMAVHSALGPGLLEHAYEEFVANELAFQGLKVERQLAIPAFFKGRRVDIGYRADLVVEGRILLEVKSCRKLLPIHEAQTLTYMKLGQYRLGLLLNFNTVLLKHGIKRLVNRL